MFYSENFPSEGNQYKTYNNFSPRKKIKKSFQSFHIKKPRFRHFRSNKKSDYRIKYTIINNSVGILPAFPTILLLSNLFILKDLNRIVERKKLFMS